MVGEVIQFIEGPVGPIACLIDRSKVNKCLLRMHCIFRRMWEKIHNVILDVFNCTTNSDFVQQERELIPPCVSSE